jgi:predicted GNAT family acetyltransferase
MRVGRGTDKKNLLTLSKSTPMLIQNESNERKGRFFIGPAEASLAELVFNYPNPDKMIIEHTEVHESLKGQGVGYRLVEAAVEWAREKQLKIIPLCPFALAVFKKRNDYADVLFRPV